MAQRRASGRRDTRPSPSQGAGADTADLPAEDDGVLRILLGDRLIQGYDTSELDLQTRQGIADRVVRYADSQTVGVGKLR